jgi:hypothetical protein
MGENVYSNYVGLNNELSCIRIIDRVKYKITYGLDLLSKPFDLRFIYSQK